MATNPFPPSTTVLSTLFASKYSTAFPNGSGSGSGISPDTWAKFKVSVNCFELVGISVADWSYVTITLNVLVSPTFNLVYLVISFNLNVI